MVKDVIFYMNHEMELSVKNIKIEGYKIAFYKYVQLELLTIIGTTYYKYGKSLIVIFCNLTMSQLSYYFDILARGTLAFFAPLKEHVNTS